MKRKRSGKPKWASSKRRAIKRVKNVDTKSENTVFEINMKEEEIYLRSQCFKIISKTIDDAVNSTIDPYIQSSVDEMHNFFFLQNDPPHYPTGINHSAHENPLAFPISHTSSEQLHLPMTILHLPSAPLDRKIIKNKILHQFRKKCHQRVLLCNINSIKDKISEWLDCDEILESIEDQFMTTDPTITPQEERPIETVTSWAKGSKHYNSLLLVLDGFDTSHKSTLQDSFKTILQLRSDHGIPISVLLLHPPYPHQIKIDTTTFGVSGLHLKESQMPTSRIIYDKIWEKLMPTLFSLGSLSFSALEIERSFKNYHVSFVLSVLELKKSLVLQTRIRGSHIFFMGTPPVCLQEWARMINYFQEDHRRSFITPNKSTSTTSDVMDRYFDEQRTARERSGIINVLTHLSKNQIPLMKILQAPLSRKTLSKLVSTFSSKIDLKSLAAAKMQLLKEKPNDFHEKFMRFTFASPRNSVCLKEISNSVNELILVLAGINCKDAIGILGDRRDNYVRTEIQNLLSKALRCFHDFTGENRSSLDEIDCAVFPQYRRNIGKALDQPPSSEQINRITRALRAPYELYELLDKATLITHADWFSAFRDVCDPSIKDEDIVSLFAVGCYALERVGIVRREMDENIGGFPSVFMRKMVALAME